MNRLRFDTRFWLLHALLPFLLYTLLVRGAHFVSHNLWSAAICWFAALGLFSIAFAGRLHFGVEIIEGRSPASLKGKGLVI